MNKNNHNRIKFIGLPRDLDIDKEIDKRVNEVYRTCPYCGENDNVKSYSVEDECVKRNCSEHFSVSDFEIEELMLNGKKPRSRRDKVFKWARMLFYCDTCGCAWSSEKYPLRIGDDQEVVQDIMEHVINGNDSPIMASIQNKLIYIPPPKCVKEIPKISATEDDNAHSSNSKDKYYETYNNSVDIISKVLNVTCGYEVSKDDVTLTGYNTVPNIGGTTNYNYQMRILGFYAGDVSYLGNIDSYHFSVDVCHKHYFGFIQSKNVNRFISSDGDKLYLSDTGEIIMMPEPLGTVYSS